MRTRARWASFYDFFACASFFIFSLHNSRDTIFNRGRNWIYQGPDCRNSRCASRSSRIRSRDRLSPEIHNNRVARITHRSSALSVHSRRVYRRRFDGYRRPVSYFSFLLRGSRCLLVASFPLSARRRNSRTHVIALALGYQPRTACIGIATTSHDGTSGKTTTTTLQTGS